MSELDALIVGAGPAGAASAAMLARAGWRVRVLDRAHFPRDKACSEYLNPEAVRVLRVLGVADGLRAQGAPTLGGTDVCTPRGDRLRGRFAVAAPARGAGLSVARRLLDAALVAAARDAGAEVCEGVRVTGVTPRADGGVGGVAVLDEGGRAAVHTARLVVGADGLRSRVARAFGPRHRGALPRVAFVAHVADVPGLEGAAEMHVAADGYVGLNPIGGGLTNVALVVPQARAAAARGDATGFFFDALGRFPAVAGRVRRARLAREVLVTGPFAVRSHPVADGALLVGDAAGFFDPFTGEGIASALLGAELVAAHGGAALATGRPIMSGDLAGYLRARRRTFGGGWAVERLIGWAMACPPLFNHAVARLARREPMAHTLVGVTGGVVPARAVLNPLFLARMVV